MRLAFGSDHAAFDLRKELVPVAAEYGHSIVEVGAKSADPYDYPDAADEVVRLVLGGECEMGVLMCGTGIGVSIRANRFKGIRAAVCCSTQTASLARQHNHANVLCLGARTTSSDLAAQILKTFLETSEDQQERHVRRVQKLDGSGDRD